MMQKFMQRGYCYFCLGKLKEAMIDNNHAIDLNPNFAEAYYRRGIYYNKMGREEEEILEYKKAIEINDLYIKEILSDAAFKVGKYYSKLNQINDALNYYIKSTQFNPNHEFSQFNVGMIYMKNN